MGIPLKDLPPYLVAKLMYSDVEASLEDTVLVRLAYFLDFGRLARHWGADLAVTLLLLPAVPLVRAILAMLRRLPLTAARCHRFEIMLWGRIFQSAAARPGLGEGVGLVFRCLAALCTLFTDYAQRSAFQTHFQTILALCNQGQRMLDLMIDMEQVTLRHPGTASLDRDIRELQERKSRNSDPLAQASLEQSIRAKESIQRNRVALETLRPRVSLHQKATQESLGAVASALETLRISQAASPSEGMVWREVEAILGSLERQRRLLERTVVELLAWESGETSLKPISTPSAVSRYQQSPLREPLSDAVVQTIRQSRQ